MNSLLETACNELRNGAYELVNHGLTLDDVSRVAGYFAVERALMLSGGRRGDAAASLGIHRNTIHRHLHNYSRLPARIRGAKPDRKHREPVSGHVSIDELAHVFAVERAISMVEIHSETCEVGVWFNTNLWPDVLVEDLRLAIRYLDERGLVIRDPARPGWVSFRDESEVSL